MPSHDLFYVISDPTRREIIDLLADRELPVNAVADRFPISRPAVSKHLRILDESGLVEIRREGRKRFCRANPEKLREVAEWVAKYAQFWDEKLDRLERNLRTGDSDHQVNEEGQTE